MTTTQNPTISDTLTGGNVTIDGSSGYVTGFHTDGRHTVGAFIKVPIQDGQGPVLYARLGRTIKGKREIVSTRHIGRDEFDRLNELDTLRRDLGWR